MAEFNPPLPLYGGDVARLIWIGRYLLDDYWQFHVDYVTSSSFSDAFTYTELQGIAAAADAALTTDIRDVIPTSSALLTLRVESRRAQATVPAVVNINLDGTQVGEALPPYCSTGMVKRTSVRGKRGRGVIHLPAYVEEGVLNGQLIAAAQTDYNNLGSALMSGFTAGIGVGAMVPCMSSREAYNPVTDRWNTRMAPLTGITLNVNLGTQNTRKFGRGI